MLPVLIINLWKLLEREKVFLVVVVVIWVALILLYQPDASQLTAFGIGVMVLLYKKIKPIWLGSMIIALGLMMIVSWVFIDSLEAVIYVEEILLLVIPFFLTG